MIGVQVKLASLLLLIALFDDGKHFFCYFIIKERLYGERERFRIILMHP